MLKFNRMNRKLNKLILQEEAFWRQHSKSFWLKDGDQNTKIFQASATYRFKKKKIETLQRDDGTSATDPIAIRKVAGDYFHQLFSSQVGEYDEVVGALEPKLSFGDNDMLTRAFEKDEFKDALMVMVMDDDKAPGPDGFNPAFFKRYWSSYGDEIFSICLE